MASNILQTTVLSKAPLKGAFKYAEIFQIYPFDEQNENYQHDHPLIIEIRLAQEVYPERSDEHWHRDIWEKERFEYIKRRSDKKKLESNDPWVVAYQEKTKQLRPSAIVSELCNLLTLFSHYRFFSYDGRQSWFIPLQRDEGKWDTSKSIWGQIGYASDKGGWLDDFTHVANDQVHFIPYNDYVKSFRDTIDLSKEYQIEFPDILPGLIAAYFALTAEQKLAYYSSCRLYNQALFFSHSLPSLSLVASVMAIEKLMNIGEENIQNCPTCGAPHSIERCDACDAPIYRIRSRFREFMRTNSSSSMDDLYKQMYDTRSRLAHGGLLRDDLFDSGFYAGEKDNEDRLRRNSLIVVHDALLQWLIKSTQ